MTKDEFLNLVNDIDDKFLNELADGKPVKKRVKPSPEEYGAPQKPKVVRLERPPKKRALRAPFIAAFTAAAAMVGAIFLVKNIGTIPTDESSGAVLLPTESPSFSIDISDYTVISEPTSYELAVTEPKIKRVLEDGSDFSLQIIDGDKEALYSRPVLKTDSENGIAICFVCNRECEGRSFTIAFHLYNEIYGTTQDRIAKQTFTAKSEIQWFTVPYKWGELKEGDKCVMHLIPEDRDYTRPVAIKGCILP